MITTSCEKWALVALRVGMGWFFLYSGLTKVFDPTWPANAAGYLTHAVAFSSFYAWFATPELLPLVSILNSWGQVFLGLSLIFGLFVWLSSILGAALMLLYYFPVFHFPHPANIKYEYLIDDHILYALTLLVLGAVRAGRVVGLDSWCSTLPICSRFPRVREWLG